ncbi:MAG: response regulator transcription factor [Prevotella sp.]|nr:response regulator transcription factor [Prevotella sp.]
MRTLKAIVVEDERLPRLTLLKKLENLYPQVEVTDSCDNYDAALNSILRQKPDLLFMDIQLQGRDALQLLAEVKQTQSLPMVIFTTAYSDRHYLMEAIKFQAVDYLLKPVDVNELAVAVAKAVEQSHADRSPIEQLGIMTFKTATGKLFLKTTDIAFLRADGNYATLTSFDGGETIMESLAFLERNLDHSVFARIDRSTIVNLQLVYKLNIKRRICTFRSLGGQQISLELSKTGLNSLMSLNYEHT